MLHVDDLFVAENKELNDTILARLGTDFQIGSEGTANVGFIGQLVRWMNDVLVVDQGKAVEELSAIPVESQLKDSENAFHNSTHSSEAYLDS